MRKKKSQEKGLAASVINLAQQAGAIRPKDLEPLGIPREYLSRLTEQGILQRVGRGLYMLPDYEVTEHHTLVEVSRLVPNGVVCLLSALRFHGLTTQAPFEVWLAIGEKAWKPKIENILLRIFRFSRVSLEAGIEEHWIEGVKVRVFNAAKTVADCFKYRNKVGLDVAIETLRDCRRNRKCSNADLWRFAKICRVSNIMRPYLEATG
jgi:predicted transcriptional regulator of viral defense system